MWTLRALRIISVLTPIAPAWIGYGICHVIAFFFYLIKVPTRRQVIDNLRHVTPGKGWIAYQIDSFKVFSTVNKNYYDLLRFRTVDREQFAELMDVRGHDNLDRALECGKGVIILAAHLGNYSVVGQYPATIGIRSAIIAERVQPPGLFNYMVRLRSAAGIDILPPGREAIPPILRLLRGNGVLMVAGDRDVSGQGVEVNFFGEPASLPAGPAILAMRTGAALIPTYTIRTSMRHSVVFIEEPLQLVRTRDRELDLRRNVQIIARSLEKMIATDPTQWAVLQRVWGAPPTTLQQRGEGLGSVPRGIAEHREPPAMSLNQSGGDHNESTPTTR
ncbi:MAG TPA: lysophospholipid acyltransferase family protein [Nitrolancea sp.]|nr:lysophospholipid acyltransferase family protein [Nitrolancea sp.]